MSAPSADLKHRAERLISRWGVVFLIPLLLLVSSGSTLLVPPHDFDIEVFPSEPTTADSIVIRLSGDWPNTCVPEYDDHWIDSSDIVWIEGIAGPEEDELCPHVFSSWSFDVRIGQLEAGIYNVWGTIYFRSDGSVAAGSTTWFEVVQEETPTPTETRTPTPTATPQEEEETCKIYGLVFEDTNRDGTWQSTEPRLANVRVALRESPQGLDLDREWTDINGKYEFIGVEPGWYYVVETDPPGYTSTTDNIIRVRARAGERTRAGDFGDIPEEEEPTPTFTPTHTPTRTPVPTITPTRAPTTPADLKITDLQWSSTPRTCKNFDLIVTVKNVGGRPYNPGDGHYQVELTIIPPRKNPMTLYFDSESRFTAKRLFPDRLPSLDAEGGSNDSVDITISDLAFAWGFADGSIGVHFIPKHGDSRLDNNYGSDTLTIEGDSLAVPQCIRGTLFAITGGILSALQKGLAAVAAELVGDQIIDTTLDVCLCGEDLGCVIDRLDQLFYRVHQAIGGNTEIFFDLFASVWETVFGFVEDIVGCTLEIVKIALELTKRFSMRGVNINSVAAASPVYVLVSNAQGQRVGFLDNGTPVQEIEGARVISKNGLKFLLYPGNNTESVRIKGYEEGIFDLRFVLSKGNSTTVEIEYLGVPTNSRMVGTVDADNERYLMAIDQNGDGITDSVREPDRVTINRPIHRTHLPLIARNHTTVPDIALRLNNTDLNLALDVQQSQEIRIEVEGRDWQGNLVPDGNWVQFYINELDNHEHDHWFENNQVPTRNGMAETVLHLNNTLGWHAIYAFYSGNWQYSGYGKVKLVNVVNYIYVLKEFSDKSDGCNGDRADFETEVVNGEQWLRLNSNRTLRCFGWVLHDNYAVQANIRAAGDNRDLGYGLVFRMETPVRYYYFRVNPFAGTYEVLKYVDGEWIQRLGPLPSPHINRDYASNELHAEIKESQIRLWVNSNYLGVVDNESMIFSYGSVGMAVSNFSNSQSAEAYYDNFLVYGIGGERLLSLPKNPQSVEGSPASKMRLLAK